MTVTTWESGLAELMNICIDKNIPFVAYRMPDDDKIITWIQLSGKYHLYETIQEVDDKPGFIYAPFHRRTNFPVVFFEPELIIENGNFNDSLISEISGMDQLYPDQIFDVPVATSKEKYLKQVAEYLKSFDKKLLKAVLSRIHLKDLPNNFSKGNFFLQLCNKYPDVFCHFIHIPSAGTWTGATPEILLRIDHENAQTVSLAGTQLKMGEKSKIIWQEKEMEEQRLVTNYIIGLLRQFGIRDFQTIGPQTIQAGKALHIKTEFCFDRSFIMSKLGDFIASLHPTPAICGMSKDKSLELILKTENHNREYYSGFCGTMNYQDKTDLFVNLRCMKILQTKMVLFAGGGLTAKSDAAKEWKETELKLQTLLSVIENS